MILVFEQSLFTPEGEQSIKTRLKRFELRGFHSHNCRDLTVAFKSLLVGHRQTNNADTTQQDEADLGSKSDQAAVKFLTIKLPLDQCSTISRRDGLNRSRRLVRLLPRFNWMKGASRRRRQRKGSDVRL